MPSFQDWQFPNDGVPALWSTTPLSSSLPNRCIITNTSYANDDAHIIPREEGPWFVRNGMSRYVTEVVSTENSRNLAKMRTDLHSCFDRRRFAIVPKPRSLSTAGPSHAFAVHMVDDGQAELTHLFHNVEVRLGARACRQYWFARFAWTVLLLVKPFIMAGLKRNVVRFRTVNDEVDYKIECLGAAELNATYSAGGSMRSISLKKRKTGNDGAAGDDEDLVMPDEYDDERWGSRERWYEDNVVAPREEEERGRKRSCRGSPAEWPSSLGVAGWSHVGIVMDTRDEDAVPGLPQSFLSSVVTDEPLRESGVKAWHSAAGE